MGNAKGEAGLIWACAPLARFWFGFCQNKKEGGNESMVSNASTRSSLLLSLDVSPFPPRIHRASTGSPHWRTTDRGWKGSHYPVCSLLPHRIVLLWHARFPFLVVVVRSLAPFFPPDAQGAAGARPRFVYLHLPQARTNHDATPTSPLTSTTGNHPNTKHQTLPSTVRQTNP